MAVHIDLGACVGDGCSAVERWQILLIASGRAQGAIMEKSWIRGSVAGM